MFESTTIYFGKNPAVSLVCDSRAEAELLAAVAREGVRGPISIPTTEEGCRILYQRLQDRLARAGAKFEELVRERAGSDRMRAQIVELLYHWFIHSFPHHLRKTSNQRTVNGGLSAPQP
jgi:6-pyruvoyl-tetrahydropterin synthase